MKAFTLVQVAHVAAASLTIHPGDVSTHGGTSLRVVASNGLMLNQEEVYVAGSVCDKLHHMSDPHGNWVYCRTPELAASIYNVTVGSYSVPLRVLDDLALFAEMDQQSGCAGDTIHIHSTKFKNATHNSHIKVNLGNMPISIDRTFSKYRPSAGESNVHQIHARVPSGLTAGAHKVELIVDIMGHGMVKLSNNEILVEPSIERVQQLGSPKSKSFRIEGSGFSLSPENNIILIHDKRCDVQKVDFHVMEVVCVSPSNQTPTDVPHHVDTGLKLVLSNKEEHVVLSNELEWPVPDPVHPTHGYQTDSFVARTLASKFVAPFSGEYSFECTNCVLGNQLNLENKSVHLLKGQELDVDLSFHHRKHGDQFRLSVAMLRDGHSNQEIFQVAPASWFVHKHLASDTVRLSVNNIPAKCRDYSNFCAPITATNNKGSYVAPETFKPQPLPRRRLKARQLNDDFCEWVQSQACSNCVIPAGILLRVSSSCEVHSLIIRGSLEWDADDQTEQTSTLTSGYIVVESGGTFNMQALSTSKQAVIYIKHNGAKHHALGERTFGSYHDPTSTQPGPVVKIMGAALGKTWSLLSENHRPGQSTIKLKDNIANLKWKIGDRIVVAPGGFPITSGSSYIGPEVFEIGSITGSTITLANGKRLGQDYLGSYPFECEVINLSRNIIITGSDFVSNKGLHTIAANGGLMQISNTRVEKCGRRGDLGRYCMHFHLIGDCKECLFQGNAIEHSEQRGIVIHGTHSSTVRENVMYALKGAYIYIEDGNEMNNVIERNVAICHNSASNKKACRASGTDNIDSDDIFQSGIWALGITNDFLENRNVNHENGFFTQVSSHIYGKGMATNKVCTMNAPLGRYEGNVAHSNWRFGWYLDSNYPRQVKQSVTSNGFVEDIDKCFAGQPCSCDEFKPDGTDNGQVGMVKNGIDWGNIFVGGYETTDVKYVGHISVNNHHNLYWKVTKNFPDGSSHVKDSLFGWYDNIPGYPPVGNAGVLGPGGLGTFIVENTKFFGNMPYAALAANQHCTVAGTGALCTPTYLLINVDFEELHPSNKAIRFGASDGNVELPMFVTQGSPGLGDGIVSVASKYMDYLLQIPGSPCQRASDRNLGGRLDDGIICNLPLRRFQVWSGDQGDLTLTGPGDGTYRMKHIKGPPGPAGYTKQGYGAPVLVSPSAVLRYKLNGVDLDFRPNVKKSPEVTLEFSDNVFTSRFGLSDKIELVINDEKTCELRNDHDRSFIGIFGPLVDGSGACTRDVTVPTSKPTSMSKPTTQPTPSKPTPTPTRAPQPTPTPTCVGPYPPEFDSCEARITWMLSDNNWQQDVYQRHGVIGTRCSVQNYLADVEGYCPPCSCDDNSQGLPEYVGCFVNEDAFVGHGWQGFTNFNHVLTPEYCIQHCKGHQYAILTYHFRCACSSSRADGSTTIKDGSCKASCEGDRTKNCGGTGGQVSVWTTGTITTTTTNDGTD